MEDTLASLGIGGAEMVRAGDAVAEGFIDPSPREKGLPANKAQNNNVSPIASVQTRHFLNSPTPEGGP